MRDPNNLIRIPNGENVTILKLDNVPAFDVEDYDLLDPKDQKKYFYDIEKMCRNSIHYRMMVNFFRENLNMNQCSFYENVSNETTSKIKIHIHHEPFSLFDITVIVFNKRVHYGEQLEVELVAKEIMFLHYLLMVGLIPVSEVVHELIPNNYLFVPVDKVLGNFQAFENTYGQWMPPEQKDMLDRIKQLTYTIYDNNMHILESKHMYIDGSGGYKLPNLNDILDIINNREQNISVELPQRTNNGLILDEQDNKINGLPCPVIFDKE